MVKQFVQVLFGGIVIAISEVGFPILPIGSAAQHIFDLLHGVACDVVLS